MKQLIKKYFTHFTFFYRYLGYRILVLLSISAGVGLLDGLGLAMFIPLFQFTADGTVGSGSESLGELKFLVDALESLGLKLTIDVVLLTVLALFIGKGLLKYLEGYYKIKVRIFFIKKLRFKLIDGLEGLSYQHFVELDAGRIQNTLSGEIGRVIQAFASYFLTAQAAIMLLVYILLALMSNFEFALLVSVAGVLSNFVYKALYKFTKEASKKVSNLSHNFQSGIIQAVHYFKYLKATNNFVHFKNRLKQRITDILAVETKIGMYNAILTATREPMVILIVVIVILVQVHFIGGSLASILLSLMFFYRSLNSLLQVQNNWQAFLANTGGIDATEKLLEDFSQSKELSGELTHLKPPFEIKLDHVSFGYKEEMILKNISLVIKPLKTLAFVGESGSGKTTLVNLIAGLLKPVKGTVQVNGVDRNELNIRQHRSHFGYITQEAVVFNDTLFNNISFWSDKTPENLERFWQAVEMASLAEFVRELPLQENTFLGDHGILVSGGQKQRISIARELYKKCDLLLLDEATSALDSETERSIQQNLESLQGKVTLLVIAHRLSTVKHADIICVMEKGEIKYMGSFRDLLEDSPTFQRMVELQEF